MRNFISDIRELLALYRAEIWPTIKEWWGRISALSTTLGIIIAAIIFLAHPKETATKDVLLQLVWEIPLICFVCFVGSSLFFTPYRKYKKRDEDATGLEGELTRRDRSHQSDIESLREYASKLEDRLKPKLAVRFENEYPFVRNYMDGTQECRLISILVENTGGNVLTNVQAKFEDLIIGRDEFPPVPLLIQSTVVKPIMLSPGGSEFLSFVESAEGRARILHANKREDIKLPKNFRCRITFVATANETPPLRQPAELWVDVVGFVSLKFE